MIPSNWQERMGRFFTRWQPYGTLVILAFAFLTHPAAAFTILCIIHWTALDELRKRLPAINLNAGIAAQVEQVERLHIFTGDDVICTNTQTYRVGDKLYKVEVGRAGTMDSECDDT